jgi:hypothetical protein
VVEEPSRRRHHHHRTRSQRALLRAHVDPAHHRRGGDADVIAERQRLLVDLHGELARRREHQHAQLAAHRPAMQALQDRQEKCGRLPGAGRGARDEIAPGQQHRNGLGVNGSRARVAHVPHGFDQLGNQIEVRIRHVATCGPRA